MTHWGHASVSICTLLVILPTRDGPVMAKKKNRRTAESRNACFEKHSWIAMNRFNHLYVVELSKHVFTLAERNDSNGLMVIWNFAQFSRIRNHPTSYSVRLQPTFTLVEAGCLSYTRVRAFFLDSYIYACTWRLRPMSFPTLKNSYVKRVELCNQFGLRLHPICDAYTPTRSDWTWRDSGSSHCICNTRLKS